MKIKPKPIKTIEQKWEREKGKGDSRRTTCQHGVEMRIATLGGCAVCTLINDRQEKEASQYRKPPAALTAAAARGRRKEAEEILRIIAEMLGCEAEVDLETVTYYDLEYIPGFKAGDIGFLMQIKANISGMMRFEPTQKQLFYLRDLKDKLMETT